MFADYFIIRIALRTIFTFVHSIAPFSIIYTILSITTFPAPPLIILNIIPIEFLIKYQIQFFHLFIYSSLESIWFIINSIIRSRISSSVSTREKLGTEERWRLWVRILESDPDPFSFLKGAFTKRGITKLPRGMSDVDAIDIGADEIGATNVMMYIAHFYFDSSLDKIKTGSLERAELNCMLQLLEATITQSRARSLSPSAAADTVPFKFRHGKSQHHVFQLYDDPVSSDHHPLLFYAFIYFASESANLLLYLAGFRFYSSTTTSSFWPFPLFFMRNSRSALDKLGLYKDHQSTEEAQYADKVGYWFHPGSKSKLDEDLTPILYLHGISGTYGCTPFIILIQWFTGRAVFVPEFPYVTMRLSSPSSILGRREISLAARRMLWRHGFGLTEEEDEEEDWRRGRVVIVAHSLGSGPAAWLLRDVPDIVAGTVLVDPMSVQLSDPSGPRNFFKTDVRTAAEIFFKFFAREKGINHFLSRHLRSSDSVLFGPKAVFPLPSSSLELIPKIASNPQDPPYTTPFYAPYVSPSPAGPFPTLFFYSQEDCILNVGKIKTYLNGTGFDESNLKIMKGQHAAVLISFYWSKEVAGAINSVADAAEKLEAERE